MLQSRIDNGSLIVGVLGAGQLAKMLANDAYRLGLRFATIENKPGSPASFMTKLDFSGDGNFCDSRIRSFRSNRIGFVVFQCRVGQPGIYFSPIRFPMEPVVDDDDRVDVQRRRVSDRRDVYLTTVGFAADFQSIGPGSECGSQ